MRGSCAQWRGLEEQQAHGGPASDVAPHRGSFAYVEFCEVSEAQAALELNESEFKGRKLKVRPPSEAILATPLAQRARGQSTPLQTGASRTPAGRVTACEVLSGVGGGVPAGRSRII